MFCGSGGSRSRLAKAAGAETLGEKGGIKNCTRLWREADLKVKMFKAPRSQSTCWRWEIEKVHPVVARSTFGSQNAQMHKLRSMFRRWDVQDVAGLVAQSRFWSQHVKNLSCSEHFWKLSCSKGACGCGAKDIRSQNAIECVNQSDLEHLWRGSVKMFFFSVVGSVQETCSSEMLLGQGADFLKRAAF